MCACVCASAGVYVCSGGRHYSTGISETLLASERAPFQEFGGCLQRKEEEEEGEGGGGGRR